MKSRTTVIAVGVLAMLCWVWVFGTGLLIASQPYRTQLAAGFDGWVLCKAILTFTPTNVALLAVLGGFLGGCSSLLLYSDYDGANAEDGKNSAPRTDEERLAFLRENPVSSALRGFAVFLAFLAGSVVGTNAAFASPTQDQYCRMAGVVAILAFAVGYDPTFFKQFISLIPRRGDKPPAPGAPPAPALLAPVELARTSITGDGRGASRTSTPASNGPRTGV